MGDRQRIEATLEELVVVLARNDSAWAVPLRAVADELAAAGNRGDRQRAMRQLLALYGGMGSFNDLVLQTQEGVSPDNDELDRLRTRAYSLAASELRR